jgi:hypothetical protein
MTEFLRLSGTLYYLKPEIYSAVLMAMNILQIHRDIVELS